MFFGGACYLNFITLQQPLSVLSINQREKSSTLLGKCLTFIPQYTEVFSWKPDQQKLMVAFSRQYSSHTRYILDIFTNLASLFYEYDLENL
jgi:hypothetical protein